MTSWMIVEDEPGIYEMLLAMSEVVGNQGIAFVDGDEAVSWIDEVDKGNYEGELPELALIDIRLPTAISGPMVGARLRKSPKLGNMGVVLITAFILRDEVKAEHMAVADADLLLPKPLPSVPEMQKILANVVAERNAKAAAAPAPPAAPVSAPASSPATQPEAPSAPPSATTAPTPPPARPSTLSDNPAASPARPPTPPNGKPPTT